MKARIILAAIAMSFGLASYAAVVPTAVWTNNLDTTQGGYSITLGEGCSFSDGAAVIGSSGGISIDLSANPISPVSILVRYSNCQAPSAQAVFISAAVQKGSDNHEMGAVSMGDGTKSVTGYWQGGSNFSFGDVTLPESGYVLFSLSNTSGTSMYVGSSISSLVGGQNTSLNFMSSTVTKLTIGAATGTQSAVTYASWDGLVIEQIAIFESKYLSNTGIADFSFEPSEEEPQVAQTVAEALDCDIGTFSFSGVSDWYIDDTVSLNGSSSMRSGAVSPSSGQTLGSSLTMNLDTKEPIRLSFWYKVSCSTYYSSIGLYIKVDNAQYNYNGEIGWTKMTMVLVPGHHTIEWKFQRYSTYSSGSNCAWVDDISFEPIMPEASKVEVSNIKCQQRYPWNGMVDIDYTVSCEDPNAEIWVYPIGYDKDSNTSMAPRSLTGDGVDAPVTNGTYRMTWKVTDDYPNFHSTAFTVKMIALTGAAPYMVVDLSGGVDALSYPVSYLASVPEGGWGDEYKTTKLVLRLIPPGSFMMGSTSDENGRGDYEDLHGVVLTKPFYIGVFEVTQKQYQLVMGSNPSGNKGDMRPVERVSYNDIRGSVNGAGWPTHNQVDANSFMGRLRSKVNMLFDLPTEAQWEYACRAGTTSALNSGKPYNQVNLKEVARCYYNSGNYSEGPWDGKGGYSYTANVGSYLGNAWGLFDMHGNVRELCRDWWNNGLGTSGAVDPKGPTNPRHRYSDYYERAYKGGCYWDSSACRTAHHNGYVSNASSSDNGLGFRVFCSPVAE